MRVSRLVVFSILGLVGCADAEKTGDPKAFLSQAPQATKVGPSEAVRAGQLVSTMVNGQAQKGTGSIGAGQTLSGTLSAGDGTLDDGSYFDAWVFVLGEPDDVSITLESSAFDTYLSLYRGSPGSLGEHLAANDDAEGTNSGLVASLAAGTYTAMANSFGAGATGAYEITLQASGGSGGGARVLRLGRSGSGRLSADDGVLTDGTHYQDWGLSGEAGDMVTVSLQSSDFDTYLIVQLGSELLGSNDDSGAGTDSEVSLTLPATGTYTIRVNAFEEGAVGAYTLSARSTGRAQAFSGFGTGGDPNGRYALLVGIDDYPGTGSDLRGPIEDARIMHRTLVDRFGFDPANIVTLNDADATRANIAQGIAQHLGQAGPDGVAVFFYSGHGTQIGENIGLTGALDPEPSGEGDQAIYVYGYNSESSVILDEELGYLIETIDAGRALVVVDACFSGEITRASGDAPQSKRVDLDDPTVAGDVRLPTSFINSELKALNLSDMSLGFGDFGRIAEAFRNPQRHVMWGASTDQQVSWTSSLGNGASVFTYYLGERLAAAPGTSTFAQVQRAVHDDVVRYIEGNGNMTMQNPQMLGGNQSMTLDAFFRQR